MYGMDSKLVGDSYNSLGVILKNFINNKYFMNKGFISWLRII